MIKDLKLDDYVSGSCFIVKDPKEITLPSGAKLFNATILDNSGAMDVKTFNYNSQYLEAFKNGNILQIYGKVKENKGRLYIDLETYVTAKEGTYSLEDLIMVSPKNFDDMKEDLKKYLDSIKNDELHTITRKIIVDNYKKYLDYPAAVKNHHEFMHGLLHHSLSMCHLIDGIIGNYSDVDRDLLISGALLHDVGKIAEFSGVVATHYTTEGNLLGHLLIGVELIDRASIELNLHSDKILLLKHLVASHHGKLEFGAIVLPSTKEAVILSMVDDLDAKMMAIEKALSTTEKGTFSDRIFPLDNRPFYKE